MCGGGILGFFPPHQRSLKRAEPGSEGERPIHLPSVGGELCSGTWVSTNTQPTSSRKVEGSATPSQTHRRAHSFDIFCQERLS